MLFLKQIAAIFPVTIKRIWSQLGLSLATTFGLAMAVALLMIVPLYADAVNFRILEEQLAHNGDSQRTPWSYMYTYIGAWHGAIEWEAVQPVTEFLDENLSRTLGLPERFSVQHVQTAPFLMFPADATVYNNTQALGFMSLASTTRIEEHVDIIEGRFPAPTASLDEPIEVLITRAYADAVGWQVGETYLALNTRNDTEQQLIPTIVVGIWVPKGVNDEFWFYAPNTFDELFIINRETFATVLAPAVAEDVYLALWYFVMDGSRVGTGQVDSLITGGARIEQRISTILPDSTTFVDPTDNLRVYRQSVTELTALLYIFDIPPIWLVLTFIGLVVGLSVSQQRNEIAVMRSRGSSPVQVFGMAVLEALLLGSIAFGLGTLLALQLTQVVGRSRSFLDFSDPTVVRVVLSQQALMAGAIAIGLALVARILPVIAASRHTIITYKQEQARTLHAPWWQRAWLDFILLFIVVYGFYTLQQQGGISFGLGEGDVIDPFQNPLLVLLPALAIFATTLVFTRLFPWAMHAASWLLTRTTNVSLLQAIRYLARTPHHYRQPLSLLILTVGLAVFTASLARTFDFQLYDENFYEIGSDINLITFQRPPAFGAVADDNVSFTYLPISEYETISNVSRATRVGNYEMRSQVDGRAIQGVYMGVDQDSFRDVAYWRWDFSDYRLGSLMNGLGNRADGILVSQNIIDETTLRVGDPLRYSVLLEDIPISFDGTIVGTFDYFPTWYPAETRYLIVGNLETVFEQAGGEFPYRVWATLESPVEELGLRIQLNDRQLFNTTWKEPFTFIETTLAEPARQGLFGILSVGFIASALLTVIGFFLYTLFSFRRRTVELGILRAVGISRGMMTRMIAWEMVFLISSGLVMGTLLGVVVSRQFIPFLQVGLDAATSAPPFLVEIAWVAIGQIYLLFGLLFLLALVVLSWRLFNMKVFESIKMGETV